MEDLAFLSFEQIEAIHADQLKRYGGADGYVERGVVESATARARLTKLFGEWVVGDAADVAANYMFAFATSQGFRDGNKRTAVGAAVAFLAINGRDLDATDEQVYELTIAITNKTVSRDVVADWLRARITTAT